MFIPDETYDEGGIWFCPRHNVGFDKESEYYGHLDKRDILQ